MQYHDLKSGSWLLWDHSCTNYLYSWSICHLHEFRIPCGWSLPRSSNNKKNSIVQFVHSDNKLLCLLILCLTLCFFCNSLIREMLLIFPFLSFVFILSRLIISHLYNITTILSSFTLILSCLSTQLLTLLFFRRASMIFSAQKKPVISFFAKLPVISFDFSSPFIAHFFSWPF